jgi:GNAT superfamily N-acetyltransferase
VGDIRDLMARVYPPPHGPEAIWSAANLVRHLECFPEGQLVVEVEGVLVGTATTHRVPLASALAPHTWSGITGHGSLSTHDPEGEALYGVNVAVDPAWQGRGVGSLLYQGRIALGRRLGCRAFVAGARIPGYHLVAADLSPEAYVAEVAAGRRFDPTLSKQLHLGFQARGVLRDYAPDVETLGHAALIVLEF